MIMQSNIKCGTCKNKKIFKKILTLKYAHVDNKYQNSWTRPIILVIERNEMYNDESLHHGFLGNLITNLDKILHHEIFGVADYKHTTYMFQ